MKITKRQLRRIIKEAVGESLSSGRPVAEIFRLESTSRNSTADSISDVEDILLAMRRGISLADAVDSVIDDPGLARVFKSSRRYRSLTPAALKAEDISGLARLAIDRIEERNRPKEMRPLTPEEEEAARIEFGRKMSSGYYGRLD